MGLPVVHRPVDGSPGSLLVLWCSGQESGQGSFASLNTGSNTLVCPGTLFLGLQTLRGKIKLIEKRMLRRVKTEVEKRVKIKTIRNPAPQSDLELQNQVLSLEMLSGVCSLHGWCGSWFAVVSQQRKLDFFSIELSTFC